MAQVLIRNLDDEVVARLKQKAANENVSLEQYLRDMMTNSVGCNKSDALAKLKEIREQSATFAFDSTAAIREDRDRN